MSTDRRSRPGHQGPPRALRRSPAPLLRRPRGTRGGHAVPPPRDGRQGHPRRPPRRGRRALPRPGRRQPDQRREPRPARPAPGRARRRAGSPPRCCGATATPSRSSSTPSGRPTQAGARRILAVLTSAYSSYSSCRQYREDLAAGPGRARRGGDRRPRRRQGPSVCRAPRLRRHRPHGSSPRRSVPLRGPPPACGSLFVTHSIPIAMDDTSGPGDGEGNLYVDQHLRVAAAVADSVRPRRSGSRPQRRARLLLAVRPAAASRGSSPTSTTGSPSSPQEGVAGRRPRAHRLRQRPHGGRPGPRHRGGRHGRRRSVSTSSGCRPSGRDPAFAAGLVDLALERAAEARGEPRRPRLRAARRRPAVGLRARVLPQPARRRAGPLREGLTWPSAPTPSGPRCRRTTSGADLERLAVDGRRRGRARSSSTSDPPTSASTARSRPAPTSSPSWTSAPRTSSSSGSRRPAPATPSSARSAAASTGDSAVTWVVDPIDGTVNYLYGIPAYAVSVAAVVGRPEGARRVPPVRRRGRQPGHRRGLPRPHRRWGLAGGPGATPSAPHGRRRRPGTRPRPRRDRLRVCRASGVAGRRASSPTCCPRSGTSDARAAPPSTCAMSRPARSTPSTRPASTPGTSPRPGSSSSEAGVVVGGLEGPGRPGPELTWAAGSRSRAGFSALVVEASGAPRRLTDALGSRGASEGTRTGPARPGSRCEHRRWPARHPG